MPNLARIISEKFRLPKRSPQSAAVGYVASTTIGIYTMPEVQLHHSDCEVLLREEEPVEEAQPMEEVPVEEEPVEESQPVEEVPVEEAYFD
ncbi:hypothetical protein V496_01165 [Pseudogymnoascus sp. VKM F-4515 (FW-2607)]|nr:hypothetical protein V496_01165 [Pseudogymnoascus sp. VKM F-4515 (FW-2607)]KFY96206.1 hypothetical protein V498_02812 [Pseudogymnoascus sp. VKM F-4517 (FW-2822)]